MIKITALIVAVFVLFSLLDDHDELAVLEQEQMSRYDRCIQQFGDVAEYRHVCYKYHTEDGN